MSGDGEPISVEEKVRSCPNCSQVLQPDATFCPQCGQKTSSKLTSLRTLLTDFFELVLTVDSRFFKTIRYLFSPGYLTKEYFIGRQVRYYKPLRLLFTTLVLFYAVFGLMYISKADFESEEYSYSTQYFAGKRAVNVIEEMKPEIGYDTLPQKQRAFVDTLQSKVKYDVVLNELDFTGDSSIPVSVSDIYELEIDSIYSKYHVSGFFEKLLVQQAIRWQKDPGGLIQSFIANTTWMILLMMPVLAFVMKLLYARRARFYVEHLVFLFHYHAAVFMALIGYLLLESYLPAWVEIAIPLLCIGFLFAAMKVYYKQGVFKTLLKLITLLLTYMGLLFFFLVITVVISALIF